MNIQRAISKYIFRFQNSVQQFARATHKDFLQFDLWVLGSMCLVFIVTVACTLRLLQKSSVYLPCNVDLRRLTIKIKHPLSKIIDTNKSNKPIAKSFQEGILRRKLEKVRFPTSFEVQTFKSLLSWHPPKLQHFKTLLSIQKKKQRQLWYQDYPLLRFYDIAYGQYQ